LIIRWRLGRRSVLADVPDSMNSATTSCAFARHQDRMAELIAAHE
jgi:hypothetical protein